MPGANNPQRVTALKKKFVRSAGLHRHGAGQIIFPRLTQIPGQASNKLRDVYIVIAGLYMLAGTMPDLSMPSIDPDDLSAGMIFYILGGVGSLLAMIGVIPYSIESIIKRS